MFLQRLFPSRERLSSFLHSLETLLSSSNNKHVSVAEKGSKFTAGGVSVLWNDGRSWKGKYGENIGLIVTRRLFPNHVIKMTTVIFREKNWIRWWSRGIVTAWLKRLEPKTYCLIKALVWETIDLQPSSRAGTTEDRKWRVKAWSWFFSSSS